MSLRELTRQALSGAEQDYTRLPLRRAVFLLALPMVMEMAMESLFAIADIFWAFKIPIAYVFAIPLGLGPTGVFIAITAAYSLLALLAALWFRAGRWKTQQV